MLIAANLFDYDAERREYVQEISLLASRLGGLNSVPNDLTLIGCPEPGMHRSFYYALTDRSGGDVAGWRFKERRGPNRGPRPLEVLIIAD